MIAKIHRCTLLTDPSLERFHVISNHQRANIAVHKNLNPAVTLKSRLFTTLLPKTVEDPKAKAAKKEKNAALCNRLICEIFNQPLPNANIYQARIAITAQI